MKFLNFNTKGKRIGLAIIISTLLIVLPTLAAAGQNEAKMSEGPVILGMVDEPKDLNPISYPDVYSAFVLMQLFDPLVRTNPDGVVNTDGRAVAEDFQVSEDGLTYTFQLQEGIKFHNGTEMTAEDVVFTIDSLRNDEEPVSPRKQDFEVIESVEATGEYEVTVKLNKSFAPFLKAAMTSVYVLPKDYIQENGWDAWEDVLIGTGPYTYEEYKTGSYIMLERNTDYWRHPAYIEKIKFAFYPEYATAIMALKKGEIHYMERLPANQWFQMEKTKNVLARSHPKMAFWPLQMNQQKEPFNNVKVRKALAYAVDSNQVIMAERTDKLADNTRSPIPPIHPAHENVMKYDQDIEKAKQLLAEAGYERVKTKLYTTPGTTEAQVIQQLVKPAGFDIELVELEWGSFLDNVESGNAPLWYSGWTGSASAYSLLNLFHSESQWNWYTGFYSNKEFDRTFEAANREPDPEKRNELYKKCQRILVNEDMGIYIMYTRYARKAMHESLHVPEDSWNPYMGAGPLVRAYEWYFEE